MSLSAETILDRSRRIPAFDTRRAVAPASPGHNRIGVGQPRSKTPQGNIFPPGTGLKSRRLFSRHNLALRLHMRRFRCRTQQPRGFRRAPRWASRHQTPALKHQIRNCVNPDLCNQFCVTCAVHWFWASKPCCTAAIDLCHVERSSCHFGLWKKGFKKETEVSVQTST